MGLIPATCGGWGLSNLQSVREHMWGLLWGWNVVGWVGVHLSVRMTHPGNMWGAIASRTSSILIFCTRERDAHDAPWPATPPGGTSAGAMGESNGRPIIFPYIDLNIQTLQQNGVIGATSGPGATAGAVGTRGSGPGGLGA